MRPDRTVRDAGNGGKDAYGMDMLISLLVPTLGDRKEELSRLLDSLVRQTCRDFEVLVISQDHFREVSELLAGYEGRLTLRHIRSERKGLSLARNLGLEAARGDVMVLSDDDCWYPDDAVETVAAAFRACPQMDVLATRIYDPLSDSLYKAYEKAGRQLTRKTDVLSRSSIELAFRREGCLRFDELFGLGATYVSGEENDFLVRCLKAKKTVFYQPVTTVYHARKTGRESPAQLVAKGAFYAKNFGFVISNLVLLRDLLKKRQNHYRLFWKGYRDYRRRSRANTGKGETRCI